jgi:hypothetical protein
MASQTEKDTARAASKTQADTAKAAARTSSTNAQTQADTAKAAAQTQADTAKAKSRQNGGDGGTSERMSQREAAAGLNLAGNDTMSGRGQPMPTMSEREAAAGLTLAGNNPISGREDLFYQFIPEPLNLDNSVDHGVYDVPPPVLFADPTEEEVKDKVPPYAFQVINDGGGTVKVREGTVNTETAEEFEASGKPTELWLKATFNASDEVTAASIVTSAGSTSATEDYRQIASITWDGNTPTIVQGIKGSQSIASCGATHQWGTLYS